MFDFTKFTSCRPEDGGQPRCKLALISDKRGYSVQTVQVYGATIREVLNKKRDGLVPSEVDILFVGEAPGRDEDNLGIPFVGQAGDILADYVENVGFDPDRSRAINMVSCKPPGNRKPDRGEFSTCLINVYHEIYRYKPKVVMLLGASALKLFNLDKLGGIGKIHGKIYDKKLPKWEEGEGEAGKLGESPTFKVIPTYHPASFLYSPNPKLRKRVTGDYYTALNAVTGNSGSNTYYTAQYKVCKTVDDVQDMVKAIKENKAVAWDTESPDLKFMTSPMILSQFSIGRDKTWLVPFYTHDPEGLDWKLAPLWSNEDRETICKLFTEIFESEDITKIAVNLKYDANVTKKWIGCDTKGLLIDISCIHQLLDENSPHGLEFLSDVEFNTGDYSEKVREIVGQGKDLNKTYDHIPDDILHPYGATDAECTYRLFERYWPLICKKKNLYNLYMEETLPAIRNFMKAEWVGNFIDEDNLLVMEKKLEEEIAEIAAACKEIVGLDFNPGSPPQVAKALQKLGFSSDIADPEKSTGVSTAKEVLSELEHRCPLAGLVLKYRSRNKLYGTYVKVAKEFMGEDQRVRFGFNLSGTVNGRPSARFLYQIPKNSGDDSMNIRSIFSEEEGYVYYYADFSQIELRVFAALTRDPEFLKALQGEGIDIHRMTAADTLNLPIEEVSEFNRDKLGKPMNFGGIFGSQGSQISQLIFENPKTGNKELIGFHRAKEFVQSFREKHPMISEYMNLIPEQALSNGCVLTNVFGRERSFPDLTSPVKAKRAAAEREAVNFTVQGAAWSIAVRTLDLVGGILDRESLDLGDVRLLNVVYDSAAYGVRKDLVEWFDQVYRTLATRPIPQLGNMKFPVKSGWGATWAEAESIAK